MYKNWWCLPPNAVIGNLVCLFNEDRVIVNLRPCVWNGGRCWWQIFLRQGHWINYSIYIILAREDWPLPGKVFHPPVFVCESVWCECECVSISCWAQMSDPSRLTNRLKMMYLLFSWELRREIWREREKKQTLVTHCNKVPFFQIN